MKSPSTEYAYGTTPSTPEMRLPTYDTAAWRFGVPRDDMNFSDVGSLPEAESLFVAAFYVTYGCAVPPPGAAANIHS
jgi:hypothetical protein